ncbi:hypothetical protein F5Y01DRAFT_266775 [Xylaria sp. FL0043]|nr:hypothetical protein F5Y01DRAFT_266775 [Xylaria sp. FL0043]
MLKPATLCSRAYIKCALSTWRRSTFVSWALSRLLPTLQVSGHPVLVYLRFLPPFHFEILKDLTKMVIDLRLLFVDPQHHRRGAGGMLIKWGIDEARKLGLPAYVESSRVGHDLYLRNGFRDIDIQSGG